MTTGQRQRSRSVYSFADLPSGTWEMIHRYFGQDWMPFDEVLSLWAERIASEWQQIWGEVKPTPQIYRLWPETDPRWSGRKCQNISAGCTASQRFAAQAAKQERLVT